MANQVRKFVFLYETSRLGRFLFNANGDARQRDLTPAQMTRTRLLAEALSLQRRGRRRRAEQALDQVA